MGLLEVGNPGCPSGQSHFAKLVEHGSGRRGYAGVTNRHKEYRLVTSHAHLPRAAHPVETVLCRVFCGLRRLPVRFSAAVQPSRPKEPAG